MWQEGLPLCAAAASLAYSRQHSAWTAIMASPHIMQEAKAKETISALKGEVASLQKLVEAGGTGGLGTAEEAALAELGHQKEELLKERDTHVSMGGFCVVRAWRDGRGIERAAVEPHCGPG